MESNLIFIAFVKIKNRKRVVNFARKTVWTVDLCLRIVHFVHWYKFMLFEIKTL